MRVVPKKIPIDLEEVEQALLSEVADDTPEVRLVIAVIATAIVDAVRERYSKDRVLARRFLRSKDLDLWCHLVGLQPDFIRSAIDLD